MFTYERQEAWARWGQAKSSSFLVTNGTGQGKIASPDFWSVYLDPLLKRLRTLGIGCHVGERFLGAASYCDDLLTIAPNRLAAQEMLAVCESWAEEYGVQFSTDEDPTKSKSKAILMQGSGRRVPHPAPLVLCGRPLPWVESANHLGHKLHESGTMEHDACCKRAQFLNRSCELQEQFSFAHPVELLQSIKLYACSFYGSNLWELGGEGANRVFNTWGQCVKICWKAPWACHRYFVPRVLSPGLTSVKVDILSKYVSFYRGLLDSPSPEVSFLAHLLIRDQRSVTGRNIQFVRKESNMDPLVDSPQSIKTALTAVMPVVPENDEWRIPYLGKLLDQRQRAHYCGDDEKTEQLQNLINSLCVN